MLTFTTFLPISRTSIGNSTTNLKHRAVSTACAKSGAVIALTREVGKNGKLATAAQRAFNDMTTLELPCVATVEYESGRVTLRDALIAGEANWLVVSSPESARIVISAWNDANRPKPPSVAAIGRGTAQVLNDGGLRVSFEPSKATFVVLAAELPYSPNTSQVLYPASAKASQNNVISLEQRGFVVNRLNTYTTETALWTPSQREMGMKVSVATFASPTTVRGWVANAGMDKSLPVACIGSTSADAARKAGFTNIHYPSSPGIEGWVDAIREAIQVNSVMH